MEALSVFILAGGESSRMGSDKPFLQVGGTTLLQRALASAETIGSQVSIAGSRSKFEQFAPVVEDIFLGRGPLGAIHAALSRTGTDLNLILAVDMPFVTTSLLSWIVGRAAENHTVVTVPRIDGRYEPLCAVYRKEFGVVAERALIENRNKIDSLFAAMPIRIIDEAELVEKGFNRTLFRNVNSPEDWSAAQAEITGSRQHL